MRVVRNTDDFAVRDFQHVVQLATRDVEAIQHTVLCDAVDPIPLRRDRAAQKISALALPRRKRTHDLPLVRDDMHGGLAPADQQLIWIPW